MARDVLLGKKAVDVLILDVRGLSSITDYYLIVTGNSAPHIKALSGDLNRAMREAGVSKVRTTGAPESEWVVADYMDVVVHIFSPVMRERYALERLWGDAPKIAD